MNAFVERRQGKPGIRQILIAIALSCSLQGRAASETGEVRFPVDYDSIYRLEGTSDGIAWNILEPAILGRASDWVRPRRDLPAGIKDVRLINESVADLRPLLEKLREKHGVPALGAVVIRSNRVIAAGVVGVRVEGSDVPAMLGDTWHHGSLTKSMTATLGAMLVEEGRLAWTNTLGEILGSLVPSMHPDWRTVTLSQLLRHQGGAPDHDFLTKKGIWQEIWKARGPIRERRRQWLTAVTTNAPPTKPGTRYIYSNTGYVFAGMMMEAVTAESWEDLMRTRVFRPLGMTTAGFGSPGDRGRTNQPWGHQWIAGKPVGTPPGRLADNPEALGPAGTVHASLLDLAKYLMWHARNAGGEGVRLLSPEMFQQLHEPEPGETYALGWSCANRAWAGGTALNHTGSNTLWFSNAWIAPKKQAAFIVATNIGDGQGKAAFTVTDEAISRMIANYLGR